MLHRRIKRSLWWILQTHALCAVHVELAGDLILRIRHFISGVTDHLRTRLIIDEKVLWKVFHALVLRGSSLGPPRGKVLTPDTNYDTVQPYIQGRF